jgi:hypothetical protein
VNRTLNSLCAVSKMTLYTVYAQVAYSMTRPSAGPSTAAAAPTASSASTEAPEPPGNSEHTSEHPTEATEDDSSTDGKTRDNQEEEQDMRDASTTTEGPRPSAPVGPSRKVLECTEEQDQAIDAAYLQAVARSSDGLVFIPSLGTPDSDADDVEGCVFGCVCKVLQGRDCHLHGRSP